MKKLIICLLLLSFISSCSYSEEAIKRRAKHQAETSQRINESQRNVEPLFDEMEE